MNMSREFMFYWETEHIILKKNILGKNKQPEFINAKNTKGLRKKYLITLLALLALNKNA